ncbi:MAG TPA: PEP-CTERM sorting domain-containing protein [Verrucomicrobiota bacterium]|nr:PEP-CTERM sorting domain-containing protein [Verrucomicrobiota bacterium]HNU51813.1 PEP-CTERM sorting domain-containing protein [Verrucomicrobiota bacterium]
MNRKTLVGMVAVALVGATSAFGQYVTYDFDSYTLGSINGQGGWEGWTGNAAVAGTVTAEQAFSGTQSQKVVKGNDSVHPFTQVNSGQWTLSMQQYIPSTASGQIYTILLNSYPNNLNWSVQTLADASANLIGQFDGSGGSGQHGSSLALVKDQWVELRYEIDFAANSVSAFYNGSLMGTHSWQYNGINELQAIDLYPDEGAETGLVGAVYYDDIKLQQIPEPGTLALLGLGGLALALRRRIA